MITAEKMNCRIVNYFDVWGNQKDGFQVNNLCIEGEIELPMDATNKDVLQALKAFGFLKKHVRMNMVEFDNCYMDVWVINEKNGKPLCAIEPVYN